MTTYGFAQPGDEMEILGLANMVFSMADAPIDFARTHPTVYGRPALPACMSWRAGGAHHRAGCAQARADTLE